MPMSQEEGSRHRSNILPAIRQERDKRISAFISKSTQSLKRSDVALRVLVSGLRVSADDLISYDHDSTSFFVV